MARRSSACRVGVGGDGWNEEGNKVLVGGQGAGSAVEIHPEPDPLVLAVLLGSLQCIHTTFAIGPRITPRAPRPRTHRPKMTAYDHALSPDTPALHIDLRRFTACS